MTAPRISIITPVHAAGNRYVADCYASLARQSVTDWEWIVVENHGGSAPPKAATDPRVKVHATEGIEGIGALKSYATAQAAAPFVVELDCDDVLRADALAKILGGFAVGADFVYSDFAEFKDADGALVAAWRDYPYSARFGWQNYAVTTEPPLPRVQLFAMAAPPVTAQNIRLIDWSPNHVRAWRKDAYIRVGGHDTSMPVIDDHDLIVRFFLAGCTFLCVPHCLYFYRVHGGNTVAERNAQIRAATDAVYSKYIQRLAERFADDAQLARIDLCGALDKPEGYFSLDKCVTHGVGIVCDLDRRWPLPDNSVGVLRAADAVEHLRDPVHTMNEAYRVLAPGGFFLIDVPSANGLGAFCDPTHRSFWNRLSFRYYTDGRFRRYVPAFNGRFQVLRVREWFPSEWHRYENVPYVQAHLAALKPGYHPMGEVLC